MLLAWYPISISHILPSPVYSLCLDHTAALVSCLYALPTGIITILLVYSIHLFSFNPFLHTIYRIYLQTFELQFSLLSSNYIYFNSHSIDTTKNQE